MPTSPSFEYEIVDLGEGEPVYAGVDTADEYLDGAFHADNWRALDDDSKGRALITSTRTLDRQIWLGEKSNPAQALDWPRTNTGVAGVVDDQIPQDIIDASIELALSLTQGSNVQNVQSTDSNISSLRAGSAAITYFRGGGNGGQPTRFPQIVWELVRPYVTGAGKGAKVAAPATAFGTDKETVTNKDFGFTRGL